MADGFTGGPEVDEGRPDPFNEERLEVARAAAREAATLEARSAVPVDETETEDGASRMRRAIQAAIGEGDRDEDGEGAALYALRVWTLGPRRRFASLAYRLKPAAADDPLEAVAAVMGGGEWGIEPQVQYPDGRTATLGRYPLPTIALPKRRAPNHRLTAWAWPYEEEEDEEEVEATRATSTSSASSSTSAEGVAGGRRMFSEEEVAARVEMAELRAEVRALRDRPAPAPAGGGSDVVGLLGALPGLMGAMRPKEGPGFIETAVKLGPVAAPLIAEGVATFRELRKQKGAADSLASVGQTLVGVLREAFLADRPPAVEGE